MSDLTLQELRNAGQKRLDELLRKEAGRMFGPSSRRSHSLPRKERQRKINKRFLAFLASFRKLLRAS